MSGNSERPKKSGVITCGKCKANLEPDEIFAHRCTEEDIQRMYERKFVEKMLNNMRAVWDIYERNKELDGLLNERE